MLFLAVLAVVLEDVVITSYSIHYTKLYETMFDPIEKEIGDLRKEIDELKKELLGAKPKKATSSKTTAKTAKKSK